MRVVRLAVLVALISGVAFPAARATPPATDWVLVRATARSDIHHGSLQLTTSGDADQTGPTTVGFGVVDGSFHGVDVWYLASGGIAVHSTRRLGSADIRVTRPSQSRYSTSWTETTDVKRGQTIALLSFVVHGTIDDGFQVVPVGPFDVHVTQGSGSTTFTVADPNDTGLAVDASVVALGRSVHRTTSSAGLVGGMWTGCNTCSGTWAAPDRVNRVWRTTTVDGAVAGLGISKGTTFAGPAGSWTWVWSGLNYTLNPAVTIAAAYAPIGDGWKLFR